MSLPFTMDFADKMIAKAIDRGIHNYQYRRTIGNDRLQMICLESESFYDGCSVNVLVYCNEKLIEEHKSLQNDMLSSLHMLIEKDPIAASTNFKVRKYFKVRKKYGGKAGELSFTLKREVLEAELAHTGWLVIVSDTYTDAYQVTNYYRRKDVVEKGHDNNKNQLGIDRVRVHDDERIAPCNFIGFIALVLRMWVHKRMDEGDLYKSFSMKKVFNTIDTQSVHIMRDGQRIVSPLTSKQKMIYKALKVDIPSSEL